MNPSSAPPEPLEATSVLCVTVEAPPASLPPLTPQASFDA